MKWGKAAVGLAGAVIGGAVAFQMPAIGATPFAAPNTPEYQAAIRCVNGVWAAIDDAGHQPIGIDRITANERGKYITVYHVHVDRVGSVQTNGDSDFLKLGITVPAPSAGYDFDRVEFFKDGKLIAPSQACDKPYANFFLTGWGGPYVHDATPSQTSTPTETTRPD